MRIFEHKQKCDQNIMYAKALLVMFAAASWTIAQGQTVTVLPPVALNSVYNPNNRGTNNFQFVTNGVFLPGNCTNGMVQPPPMSPGCVQSGLAAGAQVYTQQASDANLQTFATQLQPKIDSQISAGISAAQSQIETDLKAKLDSLPASLLTQAVKDAMQAQILAQLKPQLDDLQSQINALKPAAPPKPNAAALHNHTLSPAVKSARRNVQRMKRQPVHNIVRERLA